MHFICYAFILAKKQFLNVTPGIFECHGSTPMITLDIGLVSCSKIRDKKRHTGFRKNLEKFRQSSFCFFDTTSCFHSSSIVINNHIIYGDRIGRSAG